MKLLRRIYYNYKVMSAEEYLFNQRDAMLARRPQVKTLEVLDGANQGDALVADAIQLVATPKGKPQQQFQNYDTFERLLTQFECDLIYLQIDPSAYMARQRFISHRCALGEVEDYRKDGVQLIDPKKPITWQETVVNLLTMDMLRQNKLPKQINYKNGLYAYNYPYVQQEKVRKDLKQVFMTQISTDILEGKRTGYDLIDKVLYASLMGKQKVMLGGMPETLYRMILGKALSITELRDVFRLVLTKNKELTIPMTIKNASLNFLPHIFHLPRDLYQTAMLKQAFQASVSMFAFVGVQHWRPIQQYWIGPPHGINLTEATRIPEGFGGQTNQQLIQKQAILDVLMETRQWSKKYLSNPFPYLFEDITKVQRKQLDYYKATFLKYYHQYSQFKNRQQKVLPNKENIQQIQFMKQQQEISKLKDKYKDQISLKHIKIDTRKSSKTSLH